MNSYYDNNLNKGEKLVIEAKHNKLAIAPWIIILAVMAIIFMIYAIITLSMLSKASEIAEASGLSEESEVLADETPYIIFVGLVPLIIALLIGIPRIISVLSCKLALTNRRVIGKSGFLSIRSLDYPIDKIDNVSIKQSFFGRIFNYTTITVKSANSTRGISFKGISNANEFRNTLTDAIAKNQEEARTAQAEAIANAMSEKTATH
jgi:membrane protein YdbS with pleckstrin-like domain